MADWNPEQYGRFRGEREAPFVDLLALVQRRPGMRVADLGCGSGELTRRLHDELGAASTLGLDSSPAMIAKASRQRSPGLDFEERSVEQFEGRAAFDLIFSNAALHWVEGHEALLGRLRQMLAPGGQLAVQMPCNEEHPSHVVARLVAAEPPFRDALGGWERRSPVLSPRAYAELLHRLGFGEQLVRLQVYGGLLASKAEVVEWVKGALLTAYEARLGALYAPFLARYRERLLPLLGDERPFFYAYPRVLLWGRLA